MKKMQEEQGLPNAEPVNGNKERIQAVAELAADCTEENLWKCVMAFQRYPFFTSSGLPFTYTLKTGRDGTYTKELFIDRRTNSKSLAWSSVKLAFKKALEKTDRTFSGPKEIGEIRGISYSYSLLWRFGVIRVPADVEQKLEGD